MFYQNNAGANCYGRGSTSAVALLRHVGVAIPAIDPADIAHLWFDEDTPYAGSPTAITSLACEGSLAYNAPVIGAGAEVQIDDGVRFYGGKFLDLPGLSGAYDEAVIVVDVTRHGDPTAGAGDLVILDTDTNERSYLRYNTARYETPLPAGANPRYRDHVKRPGTRHTFVLHIDYVSKTATLIDDDGIETVVATGAATTQLNLGRILIGKASVVTLHKMGIFLAEPGGELVRSPKELWQAVSGEAQIYTAGTYEFNWNGIGQSLAQGPNDATIRTALENENRPGVRQIAGLQRVGGAAVHIHGPGVDPIDQTIAATGLQLIDVAGNAPNALLSALVEGPIRKSMGLTAYQQIVQCTAISGQSVVEFDADTPVTGAKGTVGLNNSIHAASEAQRLAALEGMGFSIPILTVLQGTADKNLLAGEYRSKATVAIDDNLSAIASITGDTPHILFYQTGGTENTATAGATWEVKQDQLDLVADYSGTLIMPIYPLELADGTHPTTESYRIMGYMAAWARAVVDKGESWNLILTATLNGTTITVTVSCRSDETLEIAPDVYSGNGISDLGFEVTGANITGTTVSGNTITITCDAVPTAVQYAFQSQDASAFLDNRGGHRGLIRTTKTLVVDGRTLYRYLPSFRTTL